MYGYTNLMRDTIDIHVVDRLEDIMLLKLRFMLSYNSINFYQIIPKIFLSDSY